MQLDAPSSPFLEIPEAEWLCANPLAFAVFDRFPVSPGHVLVITRRVVPTFFECTAEEQAALMELVGEAKRLLDGRLNPKPDGYNVGFNAGTAAGQTVPHVHVHVIPRYSGDMADPRGGVRHVIPEKGNYLAGSLAPLKKSNASVLADAKALGQSSLSTVTRASRRALRYRTREQAATPLAEAAAIQCHICARVSQLSTCYVTFKSARDKSATHKRAVLVS